MINIRQLAKLAQVSPGVVSRVLSEDPSLSISPETRQRVLDMIKNTIINRRGATAASGFIRYALLPP